MAHSPSLFLFEFNVDKLKSYIKNDDRKYDINARFADVFNLTFKHEVQGTKCSLTPTKQKSVKSLKKTSWRHYSRPTKSHDQCQPQTKLEMGSVILFESDANELRQKMENNPLELSLYESGNKEIKLGSTEVAWGEQYITYFNELLTKTDTVPLVVTTKHKIYSELSSQPLVWTKITLKISNLNNNPMPSPAIWNDQDSDKLKICENPHSDELFCKEELSNKSLITIGKNIWNDQDSDKLKICENSHSDELFCKEELSNKSVITIGKNIFAEEEIEALTHEEIFRPIDIIMLCLRKSIEALMNNENASLPVSTVKSKSMDSITRSEEDTVYNLQFRETTEKTITTTDYFVSYVSVQQTSSVSSKTSEKPGVSFSHSATNVPSGPYYNFSPCDANCPVASSAEKRSISLISLDLPEAAKDLISVTKCEEVECDNKVYRKVPREEEISEQKITIDLRNVDIKTHKIKCTCDKEEKQFTDMHPCYCSCECTFGYNKTVYCEICGGYETVGTDTLVSKTPGQPLPFPCPIFYNLGERRSTQSSNPTRISKGSKSSKSTKSSKSSKGSKGSKEKEPGTEKKKAVKKEKEKKFKFKIGFEGIPAAIGHDNCKLQAELTPRGMGWLWNAKYVPGLKPDPLWRPGACHRKIVKMLSSVKNSSFEETKKKKPIIIKPLTIKPLLTVKKEGEEFLITLESMKQYPKERLLNQYPYEDKPPITFTVGKSEEEKLVRQKQKERRAKMLEYEQRVFIQQAFRNLCHKICLKTYEQALQIMPGAETIEDDVVTITDKLPLPPCKCSDELSSEDSDQDRWRIEFSPPNVKYKPDYRPLKLSSTNQGTQYSYLDYRVLLYDKYGKEIPRYFIGPDGKRECSDLGGFWGPGHKWLEINVDGFIARDGRWAPYCFTVGPDNEKIVVDDEVFVLSDGRKLVIGVDGYIDENKKWRYYKQPKPIKKPHYKADTSTQRPALSVKKNPTSTVKSLYSVEQKGNTNRSRDKKVMTQILKDMLAKGEKLRIPNWEIPYSKYKGKSLDKKDTCVEEFKCKHSTPSTKGIVAIDDFGRKTYFTITYPKKRYEKERLKTLESVGITMSPFHLPCLKNFIDNEQIKQENYQHILNHNAEVMKKLMQNV